MLKRLVIFILALFLSPFISAAQDTVLLHNFRPEWKVLDEEEVLLSFDTLDGNTQEVLFDLNPEQYRNTLLKIASAHKIYCYINRHLVKTLSAGTTYLNIDSLKERYVTKAFRVGLLSENGFEGVETKMYLVSEEKVQISSKLQPLDRDVRSDFKDFLITGVIIFLIFYGVLWYSYPKRMKDALSLTKTFSLRLTDSDTTKIRLMEQDTIVIMSFYALVFSFIYHIIESVDFMMYWERLLHWFLTFCVVFILLMAKIILVYIVSSLFNARGVTAYYVREMINLTLLFLIIYLGVSVATILIGDKISPSWPAITKVSFIVFFALRTILLYFKILRFSGFTYLYLFSYFCATEILPLVIGYRYII